MGKVYKYFIWVVLFLVTLLTFSKGIFYLFSSIQILAKSLFMLIAFNLLGIWALQSDKTFAIIKGGIIWKIRNNQTHKIYTLIFIGLIQLGILGFAYSPMGGEYKILVVFAIVIPSLLSSSLLVKEKK